MLPIVESFVYYPLKVERVARRGKSISKKKAIVEAVGVVVEGPVNGKVYIKTLAVKNVKGKKWINTNSEFIAEIAMDDVEK